MIVVFDIGNTNVKMGIFQSGELKSSFRMATKVSSTADEYGVYVKQCFSDGNLDMKKVEGVIISSVIPALNYTFMHLCMHYFNIEPIIVSAKLNTGLTIKYDIPDQLGADRIVSCAAAVNQYGAPLIVIDFGTATTFNVINEKCEFLGGMIFAGIKTASDSLSRSAARLPKIELKKPETMIGTNSAANMQSGLYYGYIGMVEYLVGRIKNEEGMKNAKVVATGGLSELIADGTKIFDIIDRRLSLKGLYLLYMMQKNKDDKKEENRK